MNKKSIFLTLLLIGGLFTPQKTHSGGEPGISYLYAIYLGPSAAIYALIGTFKTIGACARATYKPRCASDFLKDETKITSYSAHIKIRNKQHIIFEKTLEDKYHYKFLTEEIEEIFAAQKLTNNEKIIITPIIKLTNEKIYHLKKITNKTFKQYDLNESLSNVFEVADRFTNPTYEMGTNFLYFIPLLSLIYALC